MTKINLGLIETFFALYKNGSYTKAAASIGCTPQNIAQRIKKLEESMGVTYFVKKNRSYVPTDEAINLYNRTYNLFHSLESEISSDDKNPSKIHLEVLTTTGASLLWVINEISKFMKLNDSITFSIHASEDIKIDNPRDYDIIALPQTEHSPDFAMLFTVQFTSQLYASKEYIEVNGQPKNYDDLDKHKLIAFYHRQEDYRGNPDWLLRLGMQPSSLRKPDLVINNASGIAEAISLGAGIGPLTTNNPHIKSERLVPVFPDLQKQSGEMHFCFSSHIGNNAFIRYLRECYPTRSVDA